MKNVHGATGIALTMLDLLDLMACRHPKKTSCKDACIMFGVHERSAQRYLKKMESAGLIQRDGSNPAGWQLTQKSASLLSHNVEIQK